VVPWAALWLVVAIGVSATRRDGYTAWALVGAGGTAIWLGLWITSGILVPASSTLLAVSLIGGAVGLGAFLVAAFVEWTNVRIAGALPADRLSASELTRLAAKTTKVSAGKPLLVRETPSVSRARPPLRKRRV